MIYIYFMKTKLFRVLALASLVFFFNGCTPDEVETTQDQFKPLKIVVTIDDAIQAPVNQYVNNILSVYGYGTANMVLQSAVPNNVGLNSVEYNGTAVSNTPLNINVYYYDQTGITFYPGTENFTINYDCDEITVSVYFDNTLVYQESRFLGSEDGSCPDGNNWIIQYTL
jgi:hypothetical protein